MNFWAAQYLHPQAPLLSIKKAKERILFLFPSNSNQVSEGISSTACFQRFNANHLPSPSRLPSSHTALICILLSPSNETQLRGL